MKHKIPLGASLLMVLAAILVTLSVTLPITLSLGDTDLPETTEPEGVSSSGEYSFDPEKIQDIIDRFEKLSVIGFDGEDLTDDMIKGFLAGTDDRYATYMTPEEYEEFNASYLGNYVGIGVSVHYDSEEKTVKVMDVTPDSPAQAAGFLPGDELIAVDGTRVNYEFWGLDSIDCLKEMIRGEEGTSVEVTVKRDGNAITLVATRQRVTEHTVRYTLCEYNGKKVAYIAVLGFDYPTVTQFKEAVDKATAEADYIVYDLRDNGGGLLSVVNAMLTYLLPDNKLITHIEYLSYDKFHYAGDEAKPDKPSWPSDEPYLEVYEGGGIRYNQAYAEHIVTLPSAVLINGFTASAAELFTSTLRDHGLATIVGENSYGKGCMQVTYALEDGSALKLTTALYNPPCDINYDVTTEGPDGITPDIEVIFNDEENKNYLYTMPHDKDRQFVAAFNALTDGEKLPTPPAERVN